MTRSAAPRFPLTTYRLQFNRTFTFTHAEGVVPYLHALGITDCYASSYLKAVPGSQHGYDLIDPTALNPELGTEADYWKLVETLKAHGMGQILDVIPNHMGIDKLVNPWWQDVLENGPSSPYSNFFDIDWDPVKDELRDKVLLPILGDQYGSALENQEITLHYEDGSFHLRYYDHRLPVAPKPSARILTHRLDELVQRLRAEDRHVEELQSIVTALEHLPSRSEREPHRVAERYREKRIIKRRLAALLQESPEVRAFVLDNVHQFNGTKGDPRSFDLLDGLLNDQAYRLAHWRVAAEEINYRRFFDINALAAIRMENPAVFRESHQLIFRLIKAVAVTGLRIDHVDGLYDPGAYLRQVQDWARRELSASAAVAPNARPLFMTVEKVFSEDESLPEHWPVHGTTGYDFLNLLNGLFVDPNHERLMDAIYTQFTGQRVAYKDLVYESKQRIMRASMASEINVLGRELNRLSERDRRTRDFTLNSLTHAIREIIACFPVYRTYVTAGPEPVSERDRTYIRQAVAQAKRRNPALSGLVFEFVARLLLKEFDERSTDDREAQLRFAMRFQQTTGPVTAKGIEDTAFYVYNRLVSLNEVGGDPTRFGVSIRTFHERMRERQARWPFALSATSTHDTKRGEDVRARINVLSELPELWRQHLMRWSRWNRKYKRDVEGHPAPDRNEEYLLYQTLIGAWPLVPMDEAQYREFCARIQAYMAKALKEAKIHTNWVNPNHDYNEAVARFIDAILTRSESNPFLSDFSPFQERIAQHGMWNSLGQVVLKIASPGIPDFYQGTELWGLRLVDPDNRRPVDYQRRMHLFGELEQQCAQAGEDRRGLVDNLIESRSDGRIKLYVTMIALNFRRAHSRLFLEGEYVPLDAQGVRQKHLCAFARIHEDQAVVSAIPRFTAALVPDSKCPPVGPDAWQETVLVVPSWRPGSQYRNLFTGEVLTSRSDGDRQVLPVAEIFSVCPVALLERIQ